MILLKSSDKNITVTIIEPLRGYVIIISFVFILKPLDKDTFNSSINNCCSLVSVNIKLSFSHPKSNLNSCFFKLVKPFS